MHRKHIFGLVSTLLVAAALGSLALTHDQIQEKVNVEAAASLTPSLPATPAPTPSPAPTITPPPLPTPQPRKIPKGGFKAFSYDEHIPANALRDYLIGDFLDENGRPAGKLDARRSRLAQNLGNSNWYAFPSLSSFLQQSYVYIPKPTPVPTAPPTPQPRLFDYDYTPKQPPEEYDNVDTLEEEVYDDYDDSEGDSYDEEPSQSGPAHASTNLQVEGVDEADILKTDGKYIYYLSRKKGVAVVDVRTQQPRQLAAIEPTLPDSASMQYFQDIYVSGNRLILLATADIDLAPSYQMDDLTQAYLHTYEEDMEEEEYESIMDEAPENVNYGGVVFYVYNIADQDAPELERQIELEGTLLDSRLLNHSLYFVVNGTHRVARDTAPLWTAFPLYRDSVLGDESYIVPPQHIHGSLQQHSKNFALLGAFSLLDDIPIQPRVYSVANSSALYMSKQALYLAEESPYGGQASQALRPVKGVRYHRANLGGGNYSTYLYRFSLQRHGLSLAAAGSVPGQLINQYAMDEYQNSFRVATTNSGAVKNSASWVKTNAVYTFQRSDLSLQGRVRGMAEGEQIKSVRFRGNVAYVVTFEQTDPLFVLDLANPQKPRLMGELKIPGYSTYLHPYGDKYLIGFGRDVIEYRDDDGEIYDTDEAGLKFSLFDISDMKHPKELDVLTLGGAGTFSESLHAAKTMMWDMARGRVAFPVDYVKERESWSGGIVVGFDPQGFERLADMPMDFDVHYDPDSGANLGSRFVYIGSTLYYINRLQLESYDYGTFQPLGSLPLRFS